MNSFNKSVANKRLVIDFDDLMELHRNPQEYMEQLLLEDDEIIQKNTNDVIRMMNEQFKSIHEGVQAA